MNLPSKIVAPTLLIFAALLFTACGKRAAHPLRGVVVEIYREPPGLLVDHEEIPGVMKAMTMRFAVDAETAQTLQPDQRITAKMRFSDGAWRLEDVRAIAAP